MTLFDVTRRDQLAGQQRIEQADDIDTEVVLDEFRVEFGVMRNLDWPRRCNQPPQRAHGFALRQVAVKAIEIDYVDTVRRRQLD
jgi:hypothetical protein